MEDLEITMEYLQRNPPGRGNKQIRAPFAVARKGTDLEAAWQRRSPRSTQVAEGPPPLPNVSPARKASSSSSSNYAKLLSARAPRSLGGALGSG